MGICAWGDTNSQANMCKGLYSDIVQNKEFLGQLDIIYFSRKLIYQEAFSFESNPKKYITPLECNSSS
jgi:hypothetical protein